MNLPAFILFIFSLQLICMIVGSRSSKGMKSKEDYFLAGRGVRFFPLMMTFLATQVGGGLILGSAEEAYNFGWTVLFYPLGASLGFILLGMGLGKRLAQFNITTVAQIFEVVYGSSALKKTASILSIISLFMTFVAQVVGSNKFMVSMGIENPLWFIAFWGIIIFYTSVGGLKGVVATDIIQAGFFIGAFLLCFGYASYSVEMPLATLGGENFIFDTSKMYGWLLMPLLFLIIEQDMGQRCFAAKSPKTVSQATLWASILTFAISCVPIFFGILAKEKGLMIPEGASVLMKAIEQTSTPIITAMVGCAIMAAIISTADSLINAIGSNLSQDFKLPGSIRTSQVISAAIAIIGIVTSFFFTNIVGVLMLSYELSVSCLFVPIFMALFRKEGNPYSAALAIAFGAIGFLLLRVYPQDIPRELLSIGFSMVGFGLGLLVKTKEEVV